MMIRKAFKMKLYKGMELEYQRRHEKIWPEVKHMIKESGISNYSIFWDNETDVLFAYMEIEESKSDQAMAANEIREKWWKYMCDIMETNDDNSPVSSDLFDLFHID